MVDFNKVFENAFKDKYEIKDIVNYNKFIDYISSEYNRLSINLKEIDLEISNRILNKVKANIEIIKNKSKHITKYVYELLKEELGNEIR